MVDFHDISYDGIWLREKFKGNVVVLSTIPNGIDSDGSRKLTVPIVIKDKVLDTIDKLNALFRNKNKRLIFKIQPERYYIAKLSKEISPSSAVQHSSIELEFEAEDGYAYSIENRSVTVENASEITITNAGNAHTFPTISVTNKSDNGWIGMINETGVFGAGERESVDMDEKPSRVVLIDSLMAFSGRETRMPTGDLANGSLYVSKDYISIGTKGNIGNGRHWAGGFHTAAINEAGAGVGSKRFYAHFKLTAETGRSSQTGLMKILFLDRNGKIVAGYDVYKHSNAENKAEFMFWYGGNSLRRFRAFTFTPSNREAENAFRTATHGSVDFEKVGAKLTFFYWGRHYSIDVPELADVAIAKVGIFIGQHGDRDLAVSRYFTHFKVKSFLAEIKNLDVVRGVRNPFLRGDVLKVDMSTADISINDQPRADVFAKGADFLALPPGTSKLLIEKSEWASGVNVTVEWPERWK